MVTVSTAHQTIVMIVAAAMLGAFGGVVGELLLTRGDARDEGAWERPRRLAPKYFDLGTFAGALVGMANGVLAVFLFSPVRETAQGVRQYAVERLVGIALVAGVAGPAFLRNAARRMNAELTEERMRTGLGIVKAVAEAEKAKAGATDAAAGRALKASREPAAAPNVDSVIAAVDAALSPRRSDG